MSIMKKLKSRKEIEEYLGITDCAGGRAYNNKCVAEFKRLQKKYADNEQAESCLISDLGIYIPYTEIIEQGELVAVIID